MGFLAHTDGNHKTVIPRKSVVWEFSKKKKNTKTLTTLERVRREIHSSDKDVKSRRKYGEKRIMEEKK